MPAEVTIRPVTREDHDIWMPLWKGYQRFYKTDIWMPLWKGYQRFYKTDIPMPLWKGYQRFYKTDIPDETSAITWRRFLDPDEPMFAALAFDGAKAVGMVHYIFHRSCWTPGDYVYLQDLYVEEGIRGSGIGRKLIEFVYEDAKAKGASRVHWLTHETNTDAMKLYDRIASKSGFIQYRQLFS